MYWLPVMPTSTLIVKLVTEPPATGWVALTKPDLNLFDVGDLNTAATWISLVLNIPLWIAIYYYLDTVMPNTYGI